jgi:hypothetical protein
MPREEENSLSALTTNWPVLAALVVAVFSLVVMQPKLDSPRPTPAAPQPPRNRWSNSVPGRLWQDPLEGFLNGDQTKDLRDIELATIVRDRPRIDDSFASADFKNDLRQNPALFIFIYIDSRPTPEAAEVRRRERYATLSALNTAGYAPVNSDEINYITRSGGRQEKAGSPNSVGEGPNRDFIPYEWVQPYEEWGDAPTDAMKFKYQAVCLLWINDRFIQQRTFGFFADLKAKLSAALHSSTADFAITGRINSNRLLTFLSEYRKPDKTISLGNSPPDFFSDRKGEPFAILEPALTQFAVLGRTGMLPFLRLATHFTTPGKTNAESQKGIPLYVTNSTAPRVREEISETPTFQARLFIGTDQLLADCLVQELKNRGLAPGEEGNNIAIVAEWDTEYGRSMFPIFRKAIIEAATPSARNNSASRDKNFFLYQYAYLAGLDGKLPGDIKPSDGADQKPGDESSLHFGAAKALPTADKAEGNSQIDYVRRLVTRMKSEKTPFRAIGVVGSDVYDKLLLLKALRPSFPEAVFFTTDLDARLLQPAELPHTHNLLIASHYGLSLDKNLQKNIAPFRSGYDTASYVGCLHAVGFSPIQQIVFSSNQMPRALTGAAPGSPTVLWRRQPNKNSPESTLEVMPPRLYEVARDGAYELSSYDNDPLYPPSRRQTPWVLRGANSGWLLLGLLVAAVLIYPISKPWRDFVSVAALQTEAPFRRLLKCKARPCRRPLSPFQAVLLTGLLLALVLAGFMYIAHTRSQEEPVAWFSGISVWPTAVLRLLGAIVCACAVASALEKMAKRDAEIERDNAFEEPSLWRGRDLQANSAAGEEVRSSARWPLRLLHSAQQGISMWAWKPEGSDLHKVWEEFKRHGEVQNRLWRCLLWAFFYLLLFYFLYILADHTALQTRGTLSRRVYAGIHIISEVALVGLLLFVADSTFLCYRFLSFLSSAGSKSWPNAALEKIENEIGLNGDRAREGEEALKQLLLVRLVGAATRVVARLLYAPFTVLLILLIAQNGIFENWHWDIPVVVTTLFNVAVAVSSAWLLQRSAKRVKENALAAVDKLIVPRLGEKKGGLRTKLERIKQDIAGMRSGAFASFYQNPVIRALLIPLGGGGGLAALQAIFSYL